MKARRQEFREARKDSQKIFRFCVSLSESEHEWLRKVAFLERVSMGRALTGFLRNAMQSKKGLDI